MKKIILNNSDDDFDFLLLGISCLENQYQVTSTINDNLKINLALSNFLTLDLIEEKNFKFSLFNFTDEALGIDYFLIPNKSNFEEINKNNRTSDDLFSEIEVEQSTVLIKELPKIDYFLILKGEDVKRYEFKVLEKLKNSSEIIQILAIDINKLVSKQNLIF